LAEFIKYVLAALKSAGIRDPAAVLAYGVRREAEAAAAKLGSSAAIGDIAAQRKSDGHAPVTIEDNSSTISDASTPRPVAQIIAYGTTKAEDERQSDKPATNIVPRTFANPQASTPATAAAGDEIVIDDRHLLGERRVAEMLGCSLRTLQRRRMEGKGPASTKIGRKVFYELNDLQEWIDRGKIR
jgi:predicted DNA-binding transcriptional regulator AlpA